MNLPSSWQRAGDRALSHRLHAEKVNDRLYVVRSVSCPGTKHVVYLDTRGHIVLCDCKGWRGRPSPCLHAACVARRLLRERGILIPPHPVLEVVETERTMRDQLFRMEAA